MKRLNELYEEAKVKNGVAAHKSLEIIELKRKLDISKLEVAKYEEIKELNLRFERLLDEIPEEEDEEEINEINENLGTKFSASMMHIGYTEEEINEWYEEELQKVEYKYEKNLTSIEKFYEGEKNKIILLYEKNKHEIINDYILEKIEYHLDNDNLGEELSSCEDSQGFSSEGDEEEYESSEGDSNIESNSSVEQIGEIEIDQD